MPAMPCPRCTAQVSLQQALLAIVTQLPKHQPNLLFFCFFFT
jgi:hypothetical protein